MSDKDALFPYQKFTLIFTALNVMFLFIAALPNVLFPKEFGTLGYDLNNDPADSAPLVLFLVSIISALVFLMLKKKKAAFIAALFPEIAFAIVLALGLLISLIKNLVS